MFLENFSKFINFYGKGRKLKLTGFFAMSVIAGGLELVGIAMIWPFTLFVMNPQGIAQSKYYINFNFLSDMHSQMLNIFLLGFLVLFLFIFKNFLMIAIIYLQNKFISNWKLYIGKKLMHNYLFSPYKKALQETSSEKFYNLNFLIPYTLDNFIFRVISMLTNLVIVLIILSFLFVKFFIAGLVVFAFMLLAMSLQSRFYKTKMTKIGKELTQSASKNNETMLANINNLKEIKINSSENHIT